MSTVALLGFEFAAPGFLALLVLPLAMLWLGARGGAARELFTGTLELWREVVRAQPSEERRKLRLPLALACLAVALVCAVIAMARPARVDASAPRRFTLVVDRSPSMFLEEGGQTRLERALGPVKDWLAREVRATDELVLIDPRHPLGAHPTKREVPPEALDAMQPPQPELDWSRYDRTGALWITDQLALEPRLAGYSTSGGRLVPGPIGREGRTRLDWDGERVRRVEQAFEESALSVSCDPELPGSLVSICRIWSKQRGLACTDVPQVRTLLSFETSLAGDSHEAEIGRDGWRAHAWLGEEIRPGQLETAWLSSGESVCVFASPGRIRCNLGRLAEITGDPAAFALSWGELFDACVLDPQGIVPLEERTERGAPRWKPPSRGEESAAAEPRSLVALFALLAAGLALLAWVLRGLRA